MVARITLMVFGLFLAQHVALAATSLGANAVTIDGTLNVGGSVTMNGAAATTYSIVPV